MAGKQTTVTAEFRANTEQFEANLKKANKELGSLYNQLRTNATQLKGNATDTGLLETRLKLLNTQLEQNRDKQAALSAKLEEAKKLYGEDSTEAYNLAQQLERTKNQEAAIQNDIAKTNSNLKQQEEALQGAGDEAKEAGSAYDQLKNTISEQESKLKSLTLEYQNLQRAGNGESQEAKELKSTIDGLNSELNENKSKLKEVDSALNEVEEQTSQAGDGFTVFKGVLADLASSGFQLAIDKAKEFGKEIVETGMSYESSMSRVKATSGATNEEMEQLDQKAKALGKSTKFTAGEVADGFYYMALAGWDTQQSMDGIDGVLNLATASGMDLANASDIVTDYLTAFGLEAEQSGEFVDAMTYAMSNSNTSAEDLGEAYKNCAATAHTLGYNYQEVTAVLGTMANAGIKGGEAGTALSTIMTRMATDTKGCATELKQYGVDVYDAHGNMNSLTDILQSCSNVWGTLTTEQQANLAKTVAGTNHFKSFATIMDGVTASNGEAMSSFKDMSVGLDGCEGSAAKMSETMQDNLEGDVTRLSSSFDGFKLALYDNVKPALEAVIGGLTSFSDWCGNNAGTISAIAGLIAGIGVSLGVCYGAVAAYNLITSVYTAVTTGAGIATTALGGAVAFLTSPITLVAIAIAAVIAAVVLLYNKCDWFKKFIDGAIAGIQSVIATMAPYVQSIVDTIMTTLSEAWAWVQDLINQLSPYISTIFSSVVSVLQAAWSIISCVFSVAMSIIGPLVKATFTVIKTVISTVMNVVKPIVVTAVNAISAAFSLLKPVATVVSGIFNAIKKAITSPVDKAVELVKGAVKTLKSVFNFSWKLPELKLPHISVSGGKAPYGIAGMGSLPKFSIKWYKFGGIMTKPTAFAQTGTTTHVGGEAGPEAILPLDILDGKIYNTMASVFDDRLNNLSNNSDDRLSEVIELLVDIKNRGVNTYLNGRKVSEQTGETNDIEGGRRTLLQERGLAI